MIVENPTNDDTRGQVGIGTLIIFIAMVLVAAVAAGVLINTAGLLESTASDTGSDSQAQVSNQVDVISAIGHDNDTDGTVERLNFTIKKSAGSSNIDLENLTVNYQSDAASQTLNFTSGDANAVQFNTTELTGDGDNVLDDTDERFIVTVSAQTIESGLSEGGEATVTFVDQSGASTIYGVNVPDTISGEEYVSV
ncbi:archaellin/type IV pilin N-terminal domain-containing protein [Halorubellus litoreus]|uniref:Flagellin n=1 Tax=Halorubellus litoreus TaxID=755308 RepID=A0ABD5VMQ0_9EURY